MVLVLATLILLPHRAATGQEVVVKNDSVTDFSEAAILPGFVSGEKAAAWLTTPCKGHIVRVQILWLSLFGGTGDSLQESIEIFQAGSFPTPGSQLLELLGPLMVDGALNEFTVPFPIAVDQNQTFVVSFKFFAAPPALGPSVVTDTDNCQAGKNGIFAIPPSDWLNSCSLGVSGDFVIRAVVDCENAVDSIFSDGFESGDTSAWSSTGPPP
jgi:hypothetical protein